MVKVCSAHVLKVRALTWTVRGAGLSPAQCYSFPCLYVHSKEKFISFIIKSDQEMFRLNYARAHPLVHG